MIIIIGAYVVRSLYVFATCNASNFYFFSFTRQTKVYIECIEYIKLFKDLKLLVYTALSSFTVKNILHLHNNTRNRENFIKLIT